ncbi:hypothetical protein [Tissierella sp.]|uniref:hypothetical protein n=1 Tax=Tissierella sp. TaxID=41274 RepID=UPI0030257A01
MIFIIIFLVIYTVSIVLIKKKFNLLISKHINVHSTKNNVLFGHGVATLQNAMDNMLALTSLVLLCAIFTSSNFILYHPIVRFLSFISIVFSSLNSLYMMSEIKHLSDGISDSIESNNFYIWYYKIGIYNLIVYLIIAIYLRFSFSNYITLLLLIVIGFLLGMGDLLQTKGINNYGDLGHKINQTYRMMVDIPINITKAIFLKKERQAFKNNLTNNLKNIIYGIKNYRK